MGYNAKRRRKVQATDEVYLYRVTGEKSSNPTATLQVNTIPVRKMNCGIQVYCLI